jgi:Protein of unknown function (DUF3616)
MKYVTRLVYVLVPWLIVPPAWPLPMCHVDKLELRGTPGSVKTRSELSAVAVRGRYLLVLSNAAIGPVDNYHALQVFERAGKKVFRWVRDEIIYEAADDGCADADFEAMALDGNHLYVVGSHSSVHKKLNADTSYKHNRGILTNFERLTCAGRDMLFEYKIDAKARIELPPRQINLRRLIGDSKLLSAFSELPSKENGLDIEGLAVSASRLYVGFRGPVLRDNLVPVLRMSLSDEEESELLFVKLGGRGIRDMVAVSDGFVIVGGPAGDQEMPFEIYHWDGKDMVVGHDRPAGGTITPLCALPSEDDGKPEGIAIVSRSGNAMEAIIVYDGNKRLIAKRASIPLK